MIACSKSTCLYFFTVQLTVNRRSFEFCISSSYIQNNKVRESELESQLKCVYYYDILIYDIEKYLQNVATYKVG